MKKKVFALSNLLLALMAAPEMVQGQWEYVTNSPNTNTITVTGYTSYPISSSLTIPTNISGLLVTGVGNGNAFYFADTVSVVNSVIMPGTVTSIGANAFSGQQSLSIAAIPSGVTNIGSGAYDGTKVSSLTIPGGVTNIAEGAFEYCNALTNVTISDGVTSIGPSAFYRCIRLTDITIPSSVTNIGVTAFYDCQGLPGITIPDGVRSIAMQAFENCLALGNVIVSGSVTNLGEEAFESCGLTNIYFEGDPPSIPPGAPNVFSEDVFATAYYPPCVSGWSNAFSGIPATAGTAPPLFSIATNGDGITITGYRGSCGVVIIPGKINELPVTSIAINAFENVTNLTSVTLPATVTNIGEFAFAGCSDLTSIYFDGNAPAADSTVFTNDNNPLIYYLPCASGWSNTFNGVAAILMPSSSTNFTFTTNAGTINILGYAYNNSVTCGELIIPAAINGLPVATIGGLGNSHLTSVTIPNSVTSVQANAFAGSINLTSVIIPASVTNWGPSAFNSCLNLANVTISNGLTGIGYGMFSSCASLAGITIPPSVTNIGVEAFEQCSDLASITLPGSITSIGQSAFQDCTSLTNVTLSSGLENIGAAGFLGSGLESIEIPASVTNIGAKAFLDCFNMVSIGMDAGNPFYSSVDGVLFDESQATLIQYPNGLTGNYTIPASTTSIAEHAFFGCLLNGATIPASVTDIGQYAFSESSLNSVTILGNVSIGEYCFFDCSNLTSVYFAANAPGGDGTVFYEDNSETIYYLPGTCGWNATNAFSTDNELTPVLWNPLIQASGPNFGVQTNQFGFNITGTNKFTVIVEACANLANPAWTPLQIVTLTNGSYYFTDPGWTNYPARYYGLGFP